MHPELAEEYSRIGKTFVSTLHSLGLMKHIETYNGVSLLTLLQFAHDEALQKNYFKLDTLYHTLGTYVPLNFKTVEANQYDRIETFFAEWLSYVLEALKTASSRSESNGSDYTDP